MTADLIPEAIPVAQQGCVRLAEPRCHFEATESGLRITGLDPSMLAGPYIVVFCMWHVPLAMQKAQNSASELRSRRELVVPHQHTRTGSPLAVTLETIAGTPVGARMLDLLVSNGLDASSHR